MSTVLSNGSLSSQQSGEGEIRKTLVEADLVECIVAMPAQLFYTTGIPVCIWFLTKDKSDRKVKSERKQRARKGEVLFIDARNMGTMVDRTHRELTNEDIARIAATYHSWRGEPDNDPFTDIPGFCASASLEAIARHNFVLAPGRYVGTEDVEGDGEPFEDKVLRLSQEVLSGLDLSAALDFQIRDMIRGLTHGS